MVVLWDIGSVFGCFVRQREVSVEANVLSTMENLLYLPEETALYLSVERLLWLALHKTLQLSVGKKCTV